MKNLRRCLGITIFIAAGAASAWAKVTLPVVLGSHMVLQRQMPVPVWGTADPNETVTVKFRTQEKTAVADAQGKWMLKLDPLTAGGPDVMTVTGGNPLPPPSPVPGASPTPVPVAESNVLTLEDVLVGEVWFGSGQSNMATPVKDYTHDDPALATLEQAAPYPLIRHIRNADPTNIGWQESTAEHIPGFSAQLFSFGVELQKKLNVPVGLVLGAVSGQPSGFFVPKKAYEESTACKETIAKFAATYSFDDAQKKYEQELAAWKALTPDDQKSKAQPLPPKHAGDAPMRTDGTSYVGVWYEVHVQPYIPYAIRGVLWDQGESRTVIFGLDQATLMGTLISGWRKDWGQGDFPFLYVQKPSGLGCAWDYTNPLTARTDKFVPLPAEVPNDGEERENYISIMKYPNTTVVPTSDLPSGWHPPVKSSYGLRDAATALSVVYGDKQEVYGPVYESSTVDGGKMKIHFSHVGPGLAFKNGEKLQGFAIAGADKKFVWGDAVIETSPNGVADTVVVSSPAVPDPAAVRYAWSNNQQWANLFSQDGLPAFTFRTDNWEVPPLKFE